MKPQATASRPSHGPCARRSSTWTSSAQTESIFALSNGHIGWRANLDEGEPHVTARAPTSTPFYEEVPLPYAETAYGYPEAGQTIVNVTNGKIIRLLVDDEPFDIRYGKLISHERVLDLKAGVLEPHRRVGIARPSHGARALDAARFAGASRARRHPLRGRAGGRPADIVLQSELVANEPVWARMSTDRRSAAPIVDTPARGRVLGDHRARRAVLIHSTRRKQASAWRRQWTTWCADRAGRGPGRREPCR